MKTVQFPKLLKIRCVFTGEEFGRGARLWTHGYDFYSISRPVIGTFYGGEKGGRGSWQHSQEEAQFSDARLATLLKWPGRFVLSFCL